MALLLVCLQLSESIFGIQLGNSRRGQTPEAGWDVGSRTSARQIGTAIELYPPNEEMRRERYHGLRGEGGRMGRNNTEEKKCKHKLNQHIYTLNT